MFQYMMLGKLNIHKQTKNEVLFLPYTMYKNLVKMYQKLKYKKIMKFLEENCMPFDLQIICPK